MSSAYDKSSFETRHWIMDKDHVSLFAPCVAAWQRLLPAVQQLRAVLKEGIGWIGLRGNGVQTYFSSMLCAAKLGSEMDDLKAATGTIADAARTALSVHIGSLAASRLFTACSALLEFPPGCTTQELHMDLWPREHAERCYVVLVYLTDTGSTWLPNAHATTEALWTARITTSKLSTLFRQYTVKGGYVLIFRGDVAHYGPANDCEHTRLVGYFLFSPKPGCGQASDQQYPFLERSS